MLAGRLLHELKGDAKPTAAEKRSVSAFLNSSKVHLAKSLRGVRSGAGGQLGGTPAMGPPE
jgi:hypothetical protein